MVLLWETVPRVGQRPRGLAMAISSDGGNSFDPPFTVPNSADALGGSNGSVQGLLMKKMAVDTSGRIAIVNSTLREGKESRVWLMRGQLPGKP